MKLKFEKPKPLKTDPNIWDRLEYALRWLVALTWTEIEGYPLLSGCLMALLLTAISGVVAVVVGIILRFLRFSMKPLLAFLLLFITAAVQQPETVITARVVGITDGDTIRALTNGNQSFRVRLQNVDAPEKGQAFGQAAKQNLSQYIFGRDVELHIFGTDRYNRFLSVVILDGVDINLEQVRDGMAWVYSKYIGEASPDVQARYRDAEAETQAARRELWSDPDPIPPWEWRKTEKGRSWNATGRVLMRSPLS